MLPSSLLCFGTPRSPLLIYRARRFADHGAVSAGKELRDVDPVDVTPRTLQAPELEHAEEQMRARCFPPGLTATHRRAEALG